MNIEIVAARLKTGQPKCSGVGAAMMGPLKTLEKSVLPRATATRVPTTMASKMDRRESMALPSLLNNSTRNSDSPARPTFAMLP